jgi:UDP-N-acetylglucosamine--N-acetylmuramyl-(pentapeptide) pyrophosphoryl-undecaprenol N-acetylglucosamine transferase
LNRTALLVAGGTGGHLFPALALRETLIARGWAVHVATDPRVGELIDGVPVDAMHKVPSATLAARSPGAMLRFMATVAGGVKVSRALLKRIRPDIVVGFGGYPTVPPLIAGRLARLPLVVHEQNAAIGAANRMLLRLGAVLATGFERPKGHEQARKTVHVGNPVRAAITAAARPFTPPERDGPFRFLVFGGSQGARVFSGLVPGALALLPADKRARIRIVQQARPEDLQATADTLRGMGLEADVQPFFNDMPERLAEAHLVLCRAGASTVTELAVMGRPAILVPYPHAQEHQADNARALAASGGAWLVAERDLDPTGLAQRLASLMDEPEQLRIAAEAARAQGRTDAAERLAAVVESVAGGPN